MQIEPFGLRMKTILKEAELSLINIHYFKQLSSPPWVLKQLSVVILGLTKFIKRNTHSLIYQAKMSNIQERYPTDSYIYTDYSKCCIAEKDYNANV